MGETVEVHLSGKTHIESNESEGKQTLTYEQWRPLLQAAIKGNAIFPQAYLAQGVLLANSMAQLSRESHIPLNAIVESNPPWEMVSEMFGSAKEKAHEKYGFKTQSPKGYDHPLFGVWINGKANAQSTISYFSTLVYDERHRNDSSVSERPTPNITQILTDVQTDPLFLGMLANAAGALNSEPIRDLSREYKGKISAFMRKYTPPSAAENKPLESKKGYIEKIGALFRRRYTSPNSASIRTPEYKSNQIALQKDLNEIISSAAVKMNVGLVDYVNAEHPQNNGLAGRIRSRPFVLLFGDASISQIDPFRYKG